MDDDGEYEDTNQYKFKTGAYEACPIADEIYE